MNERPEETAAEARCEHFYGACCWLCSDQVVWWRAARGGVDPPNRPPEQPYVVMPDSWFMGRKIVRCAEPVEVERPRHELRIRIEKVAKKSYR